MTGLGGYQLRALLLPLGIAGYVAVALVPPPPGSLETFGFFNWSLFSTTSQRMGDTVVRIHELDGETFDEPRLYFEMPDRFATSAAKDTRFAKTLDRLKFAIVNKDADMENDIRQIVEAVYMREARHARYDVATIIFDPIERYDSGKIERVFVHRQYVKQ